MSQPNENVSPISRPCRSRRALTIFRLALLALLFATSGCVTSMLPGDVDGVRPMSDHPRVGNVYLIRGWGGMFSWGIDDLQRELDQAGVRSQVFQHDQRDALARTLVEKYRGVDRPEPMCFVAHSAGSDDAIFIARELKRAGIRVDLIVTLDGVDETIIPNNVRLCYNYWMPGAFGNGNFLRGLPFRQESGATGRLINVNLQAEGHDLCEPGASHTTLDKDTRLRKEVIRNVLAVCPQREQHAQRVPASHLPHPPS